MINFSEKKLLTVESLTDKSFKELIENNLNQNLNYIIAVVEDVKKQVSFYDGCKFTKMKIETKGEYNIETANKIKEIYYFINNKEKPDSFNYLCSYDDLKETALMACLFANDSSLDSGQRAQYQFQVGYCFHHGKGLEQDVVQAMHCYEKAGIEGSHPEALFMLGGCYERGEGVIKDKEKALEYYSQASTYSNDPTLLLDIAQKFEKEQLIEASQLIYEKAAQNQQPLAIAYLIDFYERAGPKEHEESIKKLRAQLPVKHQNLDSESLVKKFLTAHKEKESPIQEMKG